MYQVRSTVTLPTGEVVRDEYLVNASSSEAARGVVEHVLAESIEGRVVITRCDKVKPAIFRLTRVVHGAPADGPPAFIEPDGIRTHHERTNQASNQGMFAFGLIGALRGRDEEHAARRVGAWLSSFGLASETSSSAKGCPVKEMQFVCEAIGEADSTVLPEYGSVFERALVFRGGSPSLGRKR